MRGFVVLVSLLIAVHTATCTIDVKKLHDSVNTPLIQTLTDTAATKLQTLSKEAATKLETLKDKATTTLHQLSENAHENIQDFVKSIDLNKLKELDFLNILPKVQNKLAHKHTKKIKFVKVFNEKEFLHQENVFPWKVVRRKIAYIYD